MLNILGSTTIYHSLGEIGMYTWEPFLDSYIQSITKTKTKHFLSSKFIFIYDISRQKPFSRRIYEHLYIPHNPKIFTCKTEFEISGAKAWNCLPHDILKLKSNDIFKRQLFTYLLNRQSRLSNASFF